MVRLIGNDTVMANFNCKAVNFRDLKVQDKVNSTLTAFRS